MYGLLLGDEVGEHSDLAAMMATQTHSTGSVEGSKGLKS